MVRKDFKGPEPYPAHYTPPAHRLARSLTRNPVRTTFQQPSPRSVLVRPHLYPRLLSPYLRRSHREGRRSVPTPLQWISPPYSSFLSF